MERNQTAAELAKEYEQQAIAATNDYCRLKRHQPEGGFPAVAKSIGFYTTMHVLWARIARKLAEGPAMQEGPGNFTIEGNEETRNYYDEFGV